MSHPCDSSIACAQWPRTEGRRERRQRACAPYLSMGAQDQRKLERLTQPLRQPTDALLGERAANLRERRRSDVVCSSSFVIVCVAGLLPNVGPRTMRDIARSLLTCSRRLGLAAVAGRPSPSGPHSATCGDVLGGLKLRSSREQRTRIGLGPRGSSPHEFRPQGQVGQESHLHPAVVEHSACCPGSSRDVQIALESTVVRLASSSGVQRRPAAI